MNICFFTAEVPNLRSGGVENVTYRLAKALGSRGHQVHCLTLDENDTHADLPFNHMSIGRQGDAANVVSDYLMTCAIDVVVNQAVEVRWLDIVERIKALTPTCRFIKVLHSDPSCTIKGVTDGEPNYVEGTALSRALYRISPVALARRKKRIDYTRSLYRRWLGTYDKVALLSANFVEDFNRIAATDSSSTKVVAISNPVDFPESATGAEKEKIVLFVGRLHQNAKRPDRLLAVWRKVCPRSPEWKLIIVGDGPMRQALERYCKKENLTNVEFTGIIDPLPYYRRASIIGITSTYEGLPTVCGEALANGVIPIAFSSFGAICDLISDGRTGVLIPPFHVKEYAKHLARLMADAECRACLRRNIESDAEFRKRFDINNICAQWESLFAGLIHS